MFSKTLYVTVRHSIRICFFHGIPPSRMGFRGSFDSAVTLKRLLGVDVALREAE
jgi:hypothetical protein